MSLTFPVDAELEDGSLIQLVVADERDVEPLRRLYRVIVDEENSHPHDRRGSLLGLQYILSAIVDGMVDKHWTFQ